MRKCEGVATSNALQNGEVYEVLKGREWRRGGMANGDLGDATTPTNF